MSEPLPPSPKKKTAVHDLAGRYLIGLRAYLSHPTPARSDHAQVLGRAALAKGMVTLDLARIHEHAVLALAEQFAFAEPKNGFLRRAGVFFTRALIPLESWQRATRQTNLHLKEANDTLRLHTAALARGNRKLQKEILRREAAEAVIISGKEQYRTLLDESHIMQRKLRQLTREIISAQEEERKEISRELHDDVMQTLVGINVELSALSKSASVGLESLRAKIARTQKLVANSVNAVHRFARDLRPAVLDDLGLVPALEAYSASLAERKKLKIDLSAIGSVEALGNKERTVLYRVAQEALTNVARHAQATQVTLTITAVDEVFRLEISDNGRSFPVDATIKSSRRKGLGLVGMKERVEMVGGTLVIDSVLGRGTTVRAEIPRPAEPKPKVSP